MKRGAVARLLTAQDGQAASEYAILAFWTVILIVGTLDVLSQALLDCFQDVASLICLPIP